jgi:hypothetical protein
LAIDDWGIRSRRSPHTEITILQSSITNLMQRQARALKAASVLFGAIVPLNVHVRESYEWLAAHRADLVPTLPSL